MRVLIALGGNAMTGPDGSATPQAQREAITVAMGHVATVVARGHEVVLTHGNGPQAQGTIGFTMLDALDQALPAAGAPRPVAALVSRTLVDADDPAFANATKPIGRFLPKDQAQAMIEHGETWEDRGEKGWRRVV